MFTELSFTFRKLSIEVLMKDIGPVVWEVKRFEFPENSNLFSLFGNQVNHFVVTYNYIFVKCQLKESYLHLVVLEENDFE